MVRVATGCGLPREAQVLLGRLTVASRCGGMGHRFCGAVGCTRAAGASPARQTRTNPGPGLRRGRAAHRSVGPGAHPRRARAGVCPLPDILVVRGRRRRCRRRGRRRIERSRRGGAPPGADRSRACRAAALLCPRRLGSGLGFARGDPPHVVDLQCGRCAGRRCRCGGAAGWRRRDPGGRRRGRGAQPGRSAAGPARRGRAIGAGHRHGAPDRLRRHHRRLHGGVRRPPDPGEPALDAAGHHRAHLHDVIARHHRPRPPFGGLAKVDPTAMRDVEQQIGATSFGASPPCDQSGAPLAGG